jgi:hypothetical protein
LKHQDIRNLKTDWNLLCNAKWVQVVNASDECGFKWWIKFITHDYIIQGKLLMSINIFPFLKTFYLWSEKDLHSKFAVMLKRNAQVTGIRGGIQISFWWSIFGG